MANAITGFDVQGTVDLLMKVESIPLDRLNKSEAKQEVKLSLYGQLNNQVLALKKSFDAVKSAFDATSYAATVSDNTILSAKVLQNKNIYAASHTLEVTQLAKSTTRGAVNTFAERDQALSLTGNLTFTIGASSFSVSLSATDTLDKIRDKINSASNNIGVTSSIISSTNNLGEDEYTLVVASNKTGAANAMTISGTAEASFDFSDQISIAQNAEFSIDGKDVVRSSNEVTDVLDSVSFTLLKEGTSQLNITQSSADRDSAVTKAVQDMITAYNQLGSFIAQNTASRQLTDSSLNYIKSRLNTLFGSEFETSSTFASLVDIGVKTMGTPTKMSTTVTTTTTDKDGATKTISKPVDYYVLGQREVDTTKLSEAVANNIGQLQTFFLDPDEGFLKKANEVISDIVDFGGIIPEQTTHIKEEISRLNKKIDKETDRLEIVRESLLMKYASLSALLDKSGNMMGYLDSQFATLGSFRKK